MPDANGRFKGISVPRLPWQESKPPSYDDSLLQLMRGGLTHTACGTPDCCGKCPTASGRM